MNAIAVRNALLTAFAFAAVAVTGASAQSSPSLEERGSDHFMQWQNLADLGEAWEKYLRSR